MPYSKSIGRADECGSARLTACLADPPDAGTAATRVPEPTADST